MADPQVDPALVGQDTSSDAAAPAGTPGSTEAGDPAAQPAASAAEPIAGGDGDEAGDGSATPDLDAQLEAIAAQAAANGTNISSALYALSALRSDVAAIAAQVDVLHQVFDQLAAAPASAPAPAATVPTPPPAPAPPSQVDQAGDVAGDVDQAEQLPAVALGDAGQMVGKVAQLLKLATGAENAITAGAAPVFTDAMQAAVRDFQEAAGVAAARLGAVCSETWRALEAAAANAKESDQ